MVNLNKKQLYQETAYSFPYHYLDLRVAEYALIWHIEYLSYLKVVKNLLKPFTGQRVLDAGCGDARFCYELRNAKVQVVGVDFSERAIRFAKAFNPKVEFFVQDLKNLNLPYKFDYVILIETLEHLFPEEIPIILKNLSNVLQKGGELIITVPSKNLPLSKKHFQHFSEESLKKLLSRHFRVIKVIGYTKIGFYNRIFVNLRRIGILIYPFRIKTKLVEHFYKFLKNFYTHHLAIGKPEECNGLIAVCKPRTTALQP